MPFGDWKAALEPSFKAEPKLKASFLNLVAEDRITDIYKFHSSIGTQFESKLPKDLAAAKNCLADHVTLLSVPASSWLGLLPSTSNEHEVWTAVTYVTARHIEKYIDPSFDASAPSLPPRVIVPPLIYSDPLSGPKKRFIWVTSLASTTGLPPTDLVLSLGLPHFSPGDVIYRIVFPVWPPSVYIPTCLDAGLYCAWAITPRRHRSPWGLSRHLKTGARPHPELLVEVAAIQTMSLVAERVIGAAGEMMVSSYQANYLLRRGRRGL